MNIINKLSAISSTVIARNFSVSATNNANYSCKLLVLGGGSGGCALAAKFARLLKKDEVIIVEPSEDHYFQPLWTLVGAGVKKVQQTRRPMKTVLPSNAKWLKDAAVEILPDSNLVKTREGHEILYDYLVVSVGLQNHYEMIPGLPEALAHPASGVATIYAPEYCGKVWANLRAFKGGHAVFTYPDTPIKCPGAPQKIAYLTDSYLRMVWANLRAFKGGHAVFTYPDTPIKCPGAPQKIAYLTDSYLRMSHVRARSNLTYNTCLPVIFGVKKYADALMKVVERKDIHVNYKTVLKEVRPDSREAVFYTKDKTEELTLPYDMLHVTPPMAPPPVVSANPLLADPAGYLAVDKYTLRHVAYPNVYGLGDCANTPNSKTVAAIGLSTRYKYTLRHVAYPDVYGLGDCANTPNSKTVAAIAKQIHVVELNLIAATSGAELTNKYDGYGACPLLTEYGKCILAEFVYDGVPHETMPFDQARESTIAYYMKKDLFPFIYWTLMVRGYYNGPELIRSIINPFAK